MTTSVSSWQTSRQTKWTTGCRPWLPDLECVRSRNVAPKRRSDRADAEKANKRSDHTDLKAKWRIPSVNIILIRLVNIISIRLVFSPVHSLDQALSLLDQAHSAHWCKKNKNKKQTKKKQKTKQNKTKTKQKANKQTTTTTKPCTYKREG